MREDCPYIIGFQQYTPHSRLAESATAVAAAGAPRVVREKNRSSVTEKTITCSSAYCRKSARPFNHGNHHRIYVVSERRTAYNYLTTSIILPTLIRILGGCVSVPNDLACIPYIMFTHSFTFNSENEVEFYPSVCSITVHTSIIMVKLCVICGNIDGFDEVSVYRLHNYTYLHNIKAIRN
ncbi:hypothetical protein AGLY_009845, partial [Aphis glycines]